VNPTFTWYSLLAATLVQVLVLAFFVRDPEEAH